MAITVSAQSMRLGDERVKDLERVTLTKLKVLTAPAEESSTKQARGLLFDGRDERGVEKKIFLHF